MPPREDYPQVHQREYRVEQEAQPMRLARLYVIERRSGNDVVYWNCSPEHGSGWNPHHPKQSFSPSELTQAIRLLIDQGWFADCTIRELMLRGD